MTLTTRMQVTALVGVVSLFAWVGVSIVTQSRFEERIAAKDLRIAAAKAAYGDLKVELDRSESRFRSVARTLEAKHAYLMALLDRRTTSGGTFGPVPQNGADDPARERIESSRRALLAQLGALEMALKPKSQSHAKGRRPSMSPGEGLRARLERARVRREHKRLVARIDKLEQRLLAVNGSQRGVMDFLAAQSIDDFDRAKKLVAISGLDVDDLLARLRGGNARGQGGPFIAATPGHDKGDVVPAALGVIDRQLDQWETLGLLISRLPLIAPVDHYYVASRFGKRRDPINRRWAMHFGVDLAGVYRSPILATAPGRVVKVGWNGNYGRIVEIDHGLGIRTRYGHLRRAQVKRGQKVGFRQQIGEMGNSGRSTGTHVHYEILVNGKPFDPAKFVKAGEHVLQGY